MSIDAHRARASYPSWSRYVSVFADNSQTAVNQITLLLSLRARTTIIEGSKMGNGATEYQNVSIPPSQKIEVTLYQITAQLEISRATMNQITD